MIGRAALVRRLRMERKASFAAQRRSDNIEDRGHGSNLPEGMTYATHRDFNRTWQRMRQATRRQLRGGGVNRHRAALRGRHGLRYAMYGPDARQLRNGEP